MPQLDNTQLESELRKLLGSAPLYTEFRYTGANGNCLPDPIDRFCEQCGRESTWRLEINRQQVPRDKGPNQQRLYRCTNCKEQPVFFVYSWVSFSENIEGKPLNVNSFRKYGQWPPIEERISQRLEQALQGSDDLNFYRTALRLRNFGHGIGAMAYLRRVIENHMNEMLDILNEEAQKSGAEIPPRFADKVAYAEKLFPTIIVPDNYPNPFLPLYKLTSDALHNLSERESVALFDQCRHVFEYVFSSLRPHLKERKQFLEGLQNLAKLTASSDNR